MWVLNFTHALKSIGSICSAVVICGCSLIACRDINGFVIAASNRVYDIYFFVTKTKYCTVSLTCCCLDPISCKQVYVYRVYNILS